MRQGAKCVFAVMCFGVAGISAKGQPLESGGQEMAYGLDSGWRSAGGVDGSGVAFSATVEVPDATWIRLFFAEWTLADGLEGNDGGYLKITSLEDGAVQTLDARALRQWNGSTAYFNGSAIQVELVVPEADGLSRFVVDHVSFGASVPSAASLCGADDRVLSTDPRVARIFPIGCTGFLINDHPYLFLTAGHCNSFGPSTVVQFNVPLSGSNGAIRHPGPEDQYAIDGQSAQGRSAGIGDDWAVFAAFANPNTGLTPRQAQGTSFQLVDRAPPPDGGVIRVIGHGGDNTPLTHNSVQQTDTGTYDTLVNLSIRYNDLDTTGGLSGGPIEHVGTGFTYGIHTSGGCQVPGGANSGTSITNAGLQRALADPRGMAMIDRDCNANEKHDADDVTDGTSVDFNGNGIPDECEAGGDADGDGDTDIADFAVFSSCLSGSGAPVCALMDFDDDLDIDLADFGDFQTGFGGDCGLVIMGQPEGLNACQGAETTLVVDAAGQELSYQWYRGEGAILGSTGPTLDLVLDDGSSARYRCRITSACTSVFSERAVLQIPDGPAITEQPVDAPLCVSESVTFGVMADGFGGLSYQWQRNGVDISGATDPIYDISVVGENETGFYRCVVTDSCGQTVLSDEATLFDSIVAINSPPSPGNACPESPHFLFVSASGGQSFQWYLDGVAIKGADSFFLGVTDPGTYTVEVIGACKSVFSDGVVVTSEGCTKSPR